MKKTYLSPEFDFIQIKLFDEILLRPSSETIINDVGDNLENEEVSDGDGFSFKSQQ